MAKGRLNEEGNIRRHDDAPETFRSAILSMVSPQPATELSTIIMLSDQFALQIGL